MRVKMTYHNDINNAADIPAATIVPPIRLPDIATNNPAQKAHPTYPAGMIHIRHPPRYFVTPPTEKEYISSGDNLISLLKIDKVNDGDDEQRQYTYLHYYSLR
jgi:hypothetical protein